MLGIVGKKVGMTNVYDESGRCITCTVVQAGPCTVTQIKTDKSDGYSAVQVGYGVRKDKHTTRPMKGHFDRASSEPKRKLVEFRDFEGDFQGELSLGQELRLEDIFASGEYVDVVGTSKGKGFQGVVRRHGFRGVGERTHGQGDRQRAPGSIGGASYPSRVFKGMRMAGQMGSKRVMVQNLKVVDIFREKDLIVLSGPIPGAKGDYVILQK